MNSKYNQSAIFSDEENYELPIDSCDHLISTSLRDLRKEYKDLSCNQSDTADLNEEAKGAQGRKSESK